MTIVRRATVDDASSIARVHVETWRASYAGILPDSALVKMSADRQRSSWSRVLNRREGHQTVLVAEAASGVIGFGSCGSMRAGSGLAYRGEVFTLYVDTDHQGQGAGKGLLAALFRSLIEQGMNSALLWVLAANPAQFFYQAMGGNRVAERHELLWGATLPEIGYGWADLSRTVGAGGPCSVS